MKLLFIICIVFGYTLCLGEVFAVTYKQNITLSESPVQPNNSSNISRAQLLETHIRNFENNIKDIVKKYDIKDDQTIDNTLLLTGKMKSAVEKIQTYDIEREDADNIITSIVEDLSTLNKGVKMHLKLKIDEIKKQHGRYSVAAKKIAYHIDVLHQKLETKVYSKKTLDARDKSLLKELNKLKKISRKLNNFGDIEFYKVSEMQSSLLRIVREIKQEIQIIRDL